jgi:hypothetical protein
MKLTITNLKAPWGHGARLGHVVEVEKMPAWAVGKCKPAADDVEVTHQIGTAEPVVDVDALKAEVDGLAKKLADAEAALAEQGKKLADAEAALAAATKKK